MALSCEGELGGEDVDEDEKIGQLSGFIDLSTRLKHSIVGRKKKSNSYKHWRNMRLKMSGIPE